MNISEPSTLRAVIAGYVRERITGTPHGVEVPSWAQIDNFIEKSLKIKISKRIDIEYAGFVTLKTARSAIISILNEKPHFAKNPENQNTIWLEGEIIRYLMNENIPNVEYVPQDILRKGVSSISKQRFSVDSMLSDGNKHPELLCRMFLDECSGPHNSEKILDSSITNGITCFVVLEISSDRRKIESITFTDLLSDDFNQDQLLSSFQDTEFKDIKRIAPKGRTLISKKDEKIFASFYSKINDNDIPSVTTESANLVAKSLSNLLILSYRIIEDYLLKIDIKVLKRINSSHLVRVVLDLQFGAIFAYPADQRSYWVVAFTPIQDRVPQADKFMENIVKNFDAALAKWRKFDACVH